MITIIIIFLFFQGPVWGQDLGDHLFSQNHYYNAITEYQRELFQLGKSSPEFDLSIARAHYFMGNYRESENILLNLTTRKLAPDQEVTALVLLGKIHWDNYNYDAFREVLKELYLLNSDSVRLADIQYVEAWSYFYQSKWDHGLSSLHMHTSFESQELYRRIERIKNIRYKSMYIARWLSKIIPATGQLYAGDYKNAVISFILVGSIGGSIIIDIYRKAYFTAICKYLLLYSRYASGSIYQMESKLLRSNVDMAGDSLKVIVQDFRSPLKVFESIQASNP